MRHELIQLPFPVLDIIIDGRQHPLTVETRGDLVLRHVDVRDQLLIEQVFSLRKELITKD